MKAAQPQLGPQITEKEFGDWLEDLARTFRWVHYHPYLSIRSPRGWPDYALCRPPRLVLAELKREKGKTTPSQAAWLERLGACPGVEVYLWRPSDRDEIERVLK